MKILHVVWVLRFGGIETMLMNIANEQVTLGHEVGILLIDEGAADPEVVKRLDKHVAVFCAGRKYGVFDIPAYWRLNRIIKRFKPDTIHLHSAAMFKYLAPQQRRLCNVTLHALCNKPNTDQIEKIPRVFAISQSVADDLMQKKRVKSIVNPNGINPELISFNKEKTTNKLLRIVQVSRLDHPHKGQHLLILAGKMLVDRGYTNFTIDFIGGGPSFDYLEKMVRENGMNEKIHFLGMKDQQYIYEHLCEYDLFVQPSIYEGFGLTVAEAMAAKVPVLVSSGQGPEEVIDYGKSGYVFRNGDVVDCADKIEVFLKGENDKTFVEKSFDRVRNVYNVKVTVKTYLDNYIIKGK